jgi:hypothetical protein
MSSLTSASVIAATAAALREELILQATTPSGEACTVGPHITALGLPYERFALFRYGSSRWAGECFSGDAHDVAVLFVAHVGRGAAHAALVRAHGM